jgi:hypothetical protein
MCPLSASPGGQLTGTAIAVELGEGPTTMDTFFDRKQLIVSLLLVGIFEVSVVVVRLLAQTH